MEKFVFNLEAELFSLYQELNDSTYQHGDYRYFIVSENKKREVSVASVRDRIVHRIVYDYLNPIFNPDFDDDVWSCRKNKGLLGAILRTQQLLQKNPRRRVWRGDVRKFFDNVDHGILFKFIQRKVFDSDALRIISDVIQSYQYEKESKKNRGIPIGNLTSQIFANIYLDEFDQFVRRTLNPLAYLRYGDDFIIIAETENELENFRNKAENFLYIKLKLTLHSKNGCLLKTKRGVKFLGMQIFPRGRRLNKRNRNKIENNLNIRDYSSYWGIVQWHEKKCQKYLFQWKGISLVDV